MTIESEPRNLEAYQKPPLSLDHLTPQSASQSLYDIYTERIDGLPGFRQRSYHDAKDDFEKSIIEADDGSDIEFVRLLLGRLINNDGYKEFLNDLGEFWEHHNLEEDLQNYSYCFLTNHRVFSDLPLIAGTVRDLRQGDPYSASRNHMVVGKLIPGMEVDMFGSGKFDPVTGLLKMVARQIQTVPKIPPNSGESIEAQRRVWNEETKSIMNATIEHPGNIIYVAASGSQDIVSDDGKSLRMQEVNPQTAAMMKNPRLKVIPLFFSCKSFDETGLVPASPKYKLLKPRIVRHTDEIFDLMEEFSEIGTELLADEFSKGVSYDQNAIEKLKQKAAAILHFSRND